MEKTTVNIILSAESFPLDQETTDALSPVLVTTVLKVLGRIIRQEKEKKSHPNWKK